MTYPYFFLLILILFLIFIIIYPVFQKQNERFDSINSLPVLIVSRYSEKLEWLNDDYASDFPNIIYNKGKDENYERNSNTIRTVNANNLGRCDGTYIRFVVENYNDLPEVMVFLPGSANMDHKRVKMIELLEKVRTSRNSSVYINYQYPDELDNDEQHIQQLYNFQLDNWSATNSLNKETNPENSLTPAKIRPYGKWYEHHFGEEFTSSGNRGIFGIFAVSKKDVLKRPKEFYNDLLEQLEVSSNPEVGHYCERSWTKIFSYTV